MTDLHQLLTKLKTEVNQMRATDPDLDLDAAYADALVQVFKAAAESLDVTPFEARILDQLQRMSPHEHSDPISGVTLSVELGIDRFNLYHHLRNLENRGLICRPHGPRSGYKIA